MRKENRDLLLSLTCVDLAKVFQYRPSPFERKTYRFLTENELRTKMEATLRQAKRVLLIPPIMQIDNDKIEIISKDPEIQGMKSDAKYVFIDATYGLKDRERTIFERLPNGILQTSDQLTRRRMLQIYFPLEGRKLDTPRMFNGEHFKRILDEGKYIFMLDRCIVQFEPFEKDYHRITSLTYQHIYKNMAFDCLRSTRHFGAMSFFLAWHKMIDNLVIDCLRRDYLKNAVEAICLMYNLHDISYDFYILEQMQKYPKLDANAAYEAETTMNESEAYLRNEIVGNANIEKLDAVSIEFLLSYCLSEHAEKPAEIKAAIQTYRERAEQKKQEIESLQRAHGLN